MPLCLLPLCFVQIRVSSWLILIFLPLCFCFLSSGVSPLLSPFRPKSDLPTCRGGPRLPTWRRPPPPPVSCLLSPFFYPLFPPNPPSQRVAGAPPARLLSPVSCL